MLIILFVILLILISSFFSSSETAMMALNKYKLKNLAKKGSKSAKRSLKLLSRPDRLLGMILIGNTFANIIASAILASYAETHFQHAGLVICTIILTFSILLFGEIIPKTLSAIFPSKIALAVSFPLYILLRISLPLVILLNVIANGVLKLVGVSLESKHTDSLNKDEIHTVIKDSRDLLSKSHNNMLLGVLELEKIPVKNVMIPQHRLAYVDLKKDTECIIESIVNSKHNTLIACEHGLDNILGFIEIKDILSFLNKPNIKAADIYNIIKPAYFIPDTVSLQKQLSNFQAVGKRFSVIVNEYGDVEGAVTAEDIIEEIVGEFSDRMYTQNKIVPLNKNTYLLPGDITLRELARHINIEIPNSNAKTLSGFLLNSLETIPSGSCCIKIHNYIYEITSITENTIDHIHLTIS